MPARPAMSSLIGSALAKCHGLPAFGNRLEQHMGKTLLPVAMLRRSHSLLASRFFESHTFHLASPSPPFASMSLYEITRGGRSGLEVTMRAALQIVLAIMYCTVPLNIPWPATCRACTRHWTIDRSPWLGRDLTARIEVMRSSEAWTSAKT